MLTGTSSSRRAALRASAGLRPATLSAWLLLVFVASGATLVLELAAARFLAPLIGVSLHTWTSIIGVILAGVSLGSWLGGRLADAQRSTRTLGLVLLLGGGLTASAPLVVSVFGDGASLRALQPLIRIFILTTAVFLPPSLVLGMVTPLVVRLALPDLRLTGRVVGFLYAAGTLGSLVGNFLMGFVLTAYFPVNAIVLTVGAVLALASLPLLLWTRPAISLNFDESEASPHFPRRGAPSRPSFELPRSRLELEGNTVLACAVVVVTSFCTMGIELLASRVLAPAVGLSLYSWTGIIGAVLAGISLGNYVGGQLADRRSSQSLLAGAVLVGGLACLSILISIRLTDVSDLLLQVPLIGRVIVLTVAIFFLPVFVLGTISPLVVRLAVTDLTHAGRVSGQIYAWSTLGAIAGTFLTGWFLIEALGVRPLVLLLGLILLALAFLIGRAWRRLAVSAIAAVLVGSAVAGLQASGALSSTCTRETSYFCIRVKDTLREGYEVKSLILDHLVHSYVRIGDPSYLGYEHEYVQAEIAQYEMATTGSNGLLIIGGGGYTLPRWAEAFLPSAAIEVVEIDPGVVAVNYDQLGLAPDSRIVSHALDGRQFVHELAPRGYYALVIQDAVNDLSVPYHLMTKEYNDQIRDILAPGGAYLLSVIDLYDDGQLLRAAARTMTRTFSSVQLLGARQSWDDGGASVWILAGSDQGIDLAAMRAYLLSTGAVRMRTVALEPARLRSYIDRGPQIVLTDQYAPVDNLIAPLFLRRG